MTKTLCEKYIKKNLTNYFILRISNLFGLKGSSILEKIVKNIKKNYFFISDDKNLIRDFIHVNDACEIIFKILNLKQKKLILNIGSGIPIKILNLYKFLKLKKFVKKIRFKKNYYTPQRKYFVSDTSKLKSLINYKLRYNVFNYLENELSNKI